MHITLITIGRIMMTAMTPGEVSNKSLYAQQARIEGFLGRGQGSSLEARLQELTANLQITVLVNIATTDDTFPETRQNIIGVLQRVHDDLGDVFDRHVAPLHDALTKVTEHPAKYTLGTDLKAYKATGLIGIISRFIAKFCNGVSFDSSRVDQRLLSVVTHLQGPFNLAEKEFVLSPKEAATKLMIERLFDSQNSVDSDLYDAFSLSGDDEDLAELL